MASTSARRSAARRRTQRRRPAKTRRWSAEVTRRSDALDLESGVFRKSPHAIAVSLTDLLHQSGRLRAQRLAAREARAGQGRTEEAPRAAGGPGDAITRQGALKDGRGSSWPSVMTLRPRASRDQ
ncbi:MAG: hypothetical protein DMF77_05250 [Acidobacteria bacterium]|nr:MAG: hypothetical protein DMF77_05250 [Acidobacteriota bacterium]